MNSGRSIRRPDHGPVAGPAVAAILVLVSLAGPASAAGFWPPVYRAQLATGKFGDTSGAAVAFRLPAPALLRAHRLELAFGSFVGNGDASAVVSAGPVWRWPIADSVAFVDFGFSPTLVSNPQFGERDLGGHFHFTSSLAIGARFEAFEVALRTQHTSNGGLNGSNPGLDMVGLNFAAGF